MNARLPKILIRNKLIECTFAEKLQRIESLYNKSYDLYVKWNSLYVKWHILYIKWHSLYDNSHDSEHFQGQCCYNAR